MVLWSKDPKQGYLTRIGIAKMRSVLTNDIFSEELHGLYVQKDLSYRVVTETARTEMAGLIRAMESSASPYLAIEEKLWELARGLESVSGKKQYGYLRKPLKALVDEIVAELKKVPEVARCYAVWNDQRDQLEGYYKTTPRQQAPLSHQKRFRTIKNQIIREVERLRGQKGKRKGPDVLRSRLSPIPLPLCPEMTRAPGSSPQQPSCCHLAGSFRCRVKAFRSVSQT